MLRCDEMVTIQPKKESGCRIEHIGLRPIGGKYAEANAHIGLGVIHDVLRNTRSILSLSRVEKLQRDHIHDVILKESDRQSKELQKQPKLLKEILCKLLKKR